MTVGLEGRNYHFKCVKAMQTFMVVDARLIPFIPTSSVQLEMCIVVNSNVPHVEDAKHIYNWTDEVGMKGMSLASTTINVCMAFTHSK